MALSQVLQQIAMAVGSALAAGIIAMLPRIRTYLAAKIHGERVVLLRDTLSSGAALSLARVREGALGVDAAIKELVLYVEQSMPETLDKLKLPEDKLHEMAISAYYNAAVQRG
jgi:hypothetical protein